MSKESIHFLLTREYHRFVEFCDACRKGGNFRLLMRLCSQIQRIMDINEVHILTIEVVEAARQSLIVGIQLQKHKMGHNRKLNPSMTHF